MNKYAVSFSFDTNTTLYFSILKPKIPIPVATRSKVWDCGRSLLGLWVRYLLRAWMSVYCEYYVVR